MNGARRPILTIWTLLFALGVALAFTAASSVLAKDKRQRVIEFEDEVVEGMNKRPLDSLSEISERERRSQRPHLYRRRVAFRLETQETLREMRYSP